MKRLIRSFGRSLGFSLAGVKHVVVGEANMKLHLLATVVVIGMGIGFRISQIEWALIIGCIGAVFSLECLNTAVERLADRVTKEQDPLIKQAKDSAAAAVLVVAIAAAAIGLLVFMPKILVALGWPG